MKHLLREQFERLQESAEIEQNIAQFDEAHGTDPGTAGRQERGELIARLRDSVDAYNETNREFNARIEAVLEELFAR